MINCIGIYSIRLYSIGLNCIGIYFIRIYSIGALFYKDKFYKDLFYDIFIHGDLFYKDLFYRDLLYKDLFCRGPTLNSIGIYSRRNFISLFFTRIYFMRTLYYRDLEGSYKPLFYGNPLYRVLFYMDLC